MVIPSLNILWILNNIVYSDFTLKTDLNPLHAAQENPTALVSPALDGKSIHQAEPCLKKIFNRVFPSPLIEGGKNETQTDKNYLFVAT